MVVRVVSKVGGWEALIELSSAQVFDSSIFAEQSDTDVAVAAARQLRSKGLRARSVRGEVIVEADSMKGSP